MTDEAPPGGGRFDDAGDATRRTRLANERTYLAWWRTGLTAFAVSLGAGKLVPALTDESRWPYVAVGIGFALLGSRSWPTAFRRMRDGRRRDRAGRVRPPGRADDGFPGGRGDHPRLRVDRDRRVRRLGIRARVLYKSG